MQRIVMALAGLCFFLMAPHAWAQALTGSHNIVLGNAQGERYVIGRITFSDAGKGKSAFRIETDPQLGEFFLAMRPFRCLTGPLQRLCRFPVEIDGQVISRDDLVPLEYALMFMKTKPADLHISAFNGLYYKLRWSDKGITGKLHDVNMDPFIAPEGGAAGGNKRPIGHADLSEADPRSHWLPNLSIE